MPPTGMCWKRIPEWNCISKEEKFMPGFKETKDRLLFGGNASGDIKQNPRTLKTVAKDSQPVMWISNSKAWITS